MAQNVTIIKVEDNRYEAFGVGSGIPSIEDIEELCIDKELEGDISCEYVCYNVGEGEGGVDTYFTDDEILEMYATSNDLDSFEKRVEAEGYSIECYHSDCISLTIEVN